MKEKITTGYSELQILLKELGVKFTDCGPAENNLGKQVSIDIMDEQGFKPAISLYFNINNEGEETFVCQE
jgi:hypothetical protein